MRYVVDFDAYMFAETDKKAIKLAEKIKKLINDEFPDALPEVLSITGMPFGAFRDKEKRVIYPKS